LLESQQLRERHAEARHSFSSVLIFRSVVPYSSFCTDFQESSRTKAAQGRNAPPLRGTTNDLSGVSFVDANIGTAVGGLGTILRTTTGGL